MTGSQAAGTWPGPDPDPDLLVRLDGVVKHFQVLSGTLLRRSIAEVHAVDEVSLDVRRGETLGLVGETG